MYHCCSKNEKIQRKTDSKRVVPFFLVGIQSDEKRNAILMPTKILLIMKF